MGKKMTSEELYDKRVDNLLYAHENAEDEFMKYMWRDKLHELMLKIKIKGGKIDEARN